MTTRFPNARILIVDNQSVNVRYLEKLLAEAGFTTVTATSNPRDVSKRAAHDCFDLLLLDLFMPGLNGFGLLAQLGQMWSKGGRRPVIVLTADDAPETERHAFLLGATDFLTRPFDPREVLDRIETCLATQEPTGATVGVLS